MVAERLVMWWLVMWIDGERGGGREAHAEAGDEDVDVVGAIFSFWAAGAHGCAGGGCVGGRVVVEAVRGGRNNASMILFLDGGGRFQDEEGSRREGSRGCFEGGGRVPRHYFFELDVDTARRGQHYQYKLRQRFTPPRVWLRFLST